MRSSLHSDSIVQFDHPHQGDFWSPVVSSRGLDATGKLLKAIPYKELDLNLPWQSFDIAHELTTKGIQKFVTDYRATLRRSA